MKNLALLKKLIENLVKDEFLLNKTLLREVDKKPWENDLTSPVSTALSSTAPVASPLDTTDGSAANQLQNSDAPNEAPSDSNSNVTAPDASPPKSPIDDITSTAKIVSGQTKNVSDVVKSVKAKMQQHDNRFDPKELIGALENSDDFTVQQASKQIKQFFRSSF